jgi:protease I
VVLPGGVANPDQLRTDEPGVNFIRAMFEAGRPAAVICHKPCAELVRVLAVAPARSAV